jgi:hypothetical protein
LSWRAARSHSTSQVSAPDAGRSQVLVHVLAGPSRPARWQRRGAIARSDGTLRVARHSGIASCICSGRPVASLP